jgi:hypothetical protein
MSEETLPIHREQPVSPEAQKPQYDAVLVHGYWLTEKGDKTALALRSRLAVRAAALLYKEGRVKKIFLAAGKFWGDEYPSVGELMAKELEAVYGIPPEEIVIGDEAYSTGGEVKRFLQSAERSGWTNLLDIAFDQHLKTIPNVFKQHKGRASLESVEQILRKNDPNRHVKHLLDRLASSEFEADFALYERLVSIGLNIPILNDYDRLEVRNKKARTKKGKESSLPIDIYKINGQRVEPSQRAMQIGRRMWPIAARVGFVAEIKFAKT